MKSIIIVKCKKQKTLVFMKEKQQNTSITEIYP